MAQLPLTQYGVVGNAGSAALISRDGSVDWLCLPFLDSPSHFGALLDETQGGKFQLAPTGSEYRSEQRYLQRTFVLETVFESPRGRAVLCDWMPLTLSDEEAPVLYRRIEMISGRMTWQLQCAPRFEYGSESAQGEPHRGGILFRSPTTGNIARLQSEVPLELMGNDTQCGARFTLESGERRHFAWSWGRRALSQNYPSPMDSANRWRDWAHLCPESGCSFVGPWHDAVTRSGLTLKLLMNLYSNSFAESVTTSIPGMQASNRTWDYRHAWIRGSNQIIQALSALGYTNEARAYFGWLSDTVIRDGASAIQPVYTLDGGKNLPERELAFLNGYQGSRPVRIGNHEARQFQLDLYGHVILAAAEYYQIFREMSEPLWLRLSEIADFICQAWRRPDAGPWQSRSKPEHYVASKLYCWAALDRAIGLARLTSHTVPPRWNQERTNLHRMICEQGYDSSQGSFIRSFGDREIDISGLWVPLLHFLPWEDFRVQGTLSAIRNHLGEGVLFHRYRATDGFLGQEGAHVASSLLYVRCLAESGQVDEATDHLAELCSHATSLGLWGEQIDPHTGETSGNFPSAMSHAGLIGAALSVGLARARVIFPQKAA